ncbi:hypothetical protein HOF56_00440 [Candidatus Peribacteria bacterium]|jgi:hypothetical protein|nr:hypothetical protein [Candidatus Peribacteria bacterium]MBT4021523.1 hypothetical protein [Candidatus Peribacteria bacterium]
MSPMQNIPKPLTAIRQTRLAPIPSTKTTTYVDQARTRAKEITSAKRPDNYRR